MGTFVQKKDLYRSLHYICVAVHGDMSMTVHNASVTVLIFLPTCKCLEIWKEEV